MVKSLLKPGETLYQCEECGLFYRREETAKKCQEWCGQHHSCNLQIIKEAVDNK